MMNVWSAKPKVSPAASSFEKPSWASSAIRNPRRHEEHVEEQQRRGADQPELLRERRVDEVGVQEGIRSVPPVVANVPLPRPVPRSRRSRSSTSDCDDLVPVVRAACARDRSRCDPLLDAPIAGRAAPAGDEEHEPARRRTRPSGGDVQHRQEDPVVEERAAQVVRLDEDEHRRAPDQRAAGRSPSAGPARAPRASRAGSRRGRRSA